MTLLSDENHAVLTLVQAMVGSVSVNLRHVSLAMLADGVHIQFVLAQDSSRDREEIQDIIYEFEALQITAVNVRADLIVSDGPLSLVGLLARPVFGRLETRSLTGAARP